MTQRRVVTETVDGRSRVASDGPATRLTFGSTWIDELWINSLDEPLGHHPTSDDLALTPEPGSVHWRIFSLPPDAPLSPKEGFGAAPEGLDVADEEGWHLTDTLDYVVVLDGGITLVLDDDEVDLKPGDCVVQRHTNHAWRNRGIQPVRLLAIMFGVG